MLQYVIDYGFSYGLLILIGIFNLYHIKKKKAYKIASKELKILTYTAFILHEGAIIFNLIYTGIMGWNEKPINQLELWLDHMYIAILITAIIMSLVTSFKIELRYKLIKEAIIRRNRNK